MEKLKLIIKQSDIDKLDKEIRNGNVQTLTLGGTEMCMLTEKNKVSIWPRHWKAYSSHKDGYVFKWELEMKYFLRDFAELILDINKKDWSEDNIIYEIENDKSEKV